MRTFSAKESQVKRSWYVVDAQGKTLGRLASSIASRLRGKHKPEFTPHMDTGDYIVVINADKVHVTGNKLHDKLYHHHTGYVGHLKSVNFSTMLANKPEKVLQLAVKGMLPKGPLGRKMIKKMKIYAGAEHAHSAQQPEPLDI